MLQLKRFLFIIYAIVAVGVFIGALISPQFRARTNASAPLRDALLPPPEPIVVSVLYSTEKEAWLKDVIAAYQSSRPLLNGHPIQIALQQMGSREMYLAVLDGTAQPTLISPASSLQTSILEDLSTRKFGNPLVRAAACRSVVQTPLVLAAWKERADVLWGNTPPADVWKKLHDALINPKGWEAYNHPEWGYIKFGHTDPLKSNSGFMTILLMAYDYFGTTSGLTSQQILSDAGFRQWFTEIESTISKFGDSTGTYMKDMVAYGPSVYDLTAVYESTAIEQAANALGRYGELRVYYPPATIMSDHPFCVLQAEWVKPDQAQAAQQFVDYLLSQPAQEKALIKYGFRPTDQAITLDQPAGPFQRFAANGLTINLPPQIDLPPGDALNTLLDFWSRNVQP
jgi:ABC-type Fe3+ transport system substrate-binding protein